MHQGKPKISVLYVTNRDGGLDILKDNLRKQTFKDYEVVIVDGYEYRDIAFDGKYVKEPEKKKGDVWSLNKAYNEGLRHCEGELIVSLQDYIWIPKDGLEKFWNLYQETGHWISGVGHKALEEYEEYKIPTGISEYDTRIDGKEEIVETNYSQFELNYSAFPRKDIEDLGGFDEEFDKGYSCDNFNISLRAHLTGKKFLLDKTNKCIGYNQEKMFPRPEDWEEKHNRYKRYPETAEKLINGEISPKLNYI